MSNVWLSFHDGVLKRYSVRVRCVSHKSIAQGEVVVFSTSTTDAKIAAVEKQVDKYLRHQSKRTRWVVTAEPEEC